MSSPIQVLIDNITEAQENLAKAEAELATWTTTSPGDTTSSRYLALSTHVTVCRAHFTTQVQRINDITLAAQRITLHEFLKIIPPLPQYADHLPSASSTIPPNVRHPQLILHWESFEQEVLDFVSTTIEMGPQTVLPPAFMLDEIIESDVPALQMFISRNCIRPVAMHFGGTVITSEYGNTNGSTDCHVQRDRCSTPSEAPSTLTLLKKNV